MAAPVWAAQNTQGQAKVWIEYKGPQVLDACDPGMPSTHSAVNVEAFGGFFEPGIDSGLKQARVSFSPHDVLETAYASDPNSWVPIPSNGQIKASLTKGDNIIYFRQKGSSYAPMPTSERRTVQVNLLTSCSDCRGAPGGTAISSQRGVFVGPGRKVERQCIGHNCCQDNPPPSDATGAFCTFLMNEETGCRVRVQAPGAETYTWENCSASGTNGRWCNSVPNRISDPVCATRPLYDYGWDLPTAVSLHDNTAHYQVGNSGTVFNVQYNGYGCD